MQHYSGILFGCRPTPRTYVLDVLEHLRAPAELRELARELDAAKRAGDEKAAAEVLRKARRVYRRLKNS